MAAVVVGKGGGGKPPPPAIYIKGNSLSSKQLWLHGKHILHSIATICNVWTRGTILYITCYTKNVIYMVQWNRCNLQYIGETKRRLKDRFNEHRRAVDKTKIKSKPTTVSDHFLSHSNHSHTDMQLIPLEKIHSSRDSVRKARESHLIDKAMTLEPHGLNRRDELL